MRVKPQPRMKPTREGTEVCREILYEELRGAEKIRGRSLEEIFDAIIEAHDPVFSERKLGQLLGLSTLEAYTLMRTDLPVFFRNHPRILGLLSESAGSLIPWCNGGGNDMSQGYVALSDSERAVLFNQGWDKINLVFERYRIEDVLVEVTGTPQNVALLHMLFRYFRRRVVVRSYVVRPVGRPQPKLDQWIADVCSYFGLDPIEFDRTSAGEDLAENPETYFVELVEDVGKKGRGGALAVLRSNGEFGVNIDPSLFEAAGIEIIDPLEDWGKDGVFTYLKANELIRDDRLFELALAGESLEAFDLSEESLPEQPEIDPAPDSSESTTEGGESLEAFDLSEESLSEQPEIDPAHDSSESTTEGGEEFVSAPLDLTGWSMGEKDGRIRFKGTLKKRSDVPEEILFALEASRGDAVDEAGRNLSE